MPTKKALRDTQDLSPVIPRVPMFKWGLIGGLGLLFAALIGVVVSHLATVLIYIGLALFLALGLDPLVSFLERRKLPRAGAVAIVVIASLVVTAGVVLAIVPTIVEQVTNLVKEFPGWVDDITASDWYKDITTQFGSNITDAFNGILTFVQDPGNLTSIGGGVLAVGTGIAGGLSGAVIVLILTLYFLGSLQSIKSVSARFVPAYGRPRFSSLMEDIAGAVGRYVIGQVSLALINGVLTLILMTIVQAPVPLLLALIAFLGSLIPLVGTLTGSIINTLICLFVNPTTALIVGIYYLVYMQIESYVINPRIMNKAVAVPGAVVVIAAVAGGTIGGVLGALVAIPIAASAIIIIQKVVFPTQDSKKVAPNTVAS